jgi:hypothetical protein
MVAVVMAGTAEIWLDPERRFIRQRVVGDINLADFKRIEDETRRLAKELRDPDRVGVLFDGRNAQKPSFPARRAMLQLLRDPTLPRIAFCGATPVGRLLVRFMALAVGVKKVRVFEREEEAIEWLLS